MVDGLHGLRHHAVVRRHNQHGDIRGFGATHTHGRKRLMSRRIQEGNLLSVNLNHVSADVLGNAARLAGCHIGLTDGIQKGGFAVVNMAHNADYRRSGNHIRLVLLVFLQKLLDDVHLHFLLAEDIVLHGNLFRLVVINLLVQRHDGSL